MNKKPSKAQDAELKTFIKAGGRSNAEADFNNILKSAAQPKKQSTAKPTNKKKA